MPKVVVECKSQWVAEILRRKIAEIVEKIEIDYHLIGVIGEVEVIE